MSLLLSCLLLQEFLVWYCPSPWWIPNLAIAGLVISTAEAPKRWGRWVSLVGIWLLLWTTRHAVMLVFSLLLIGWMVRQLAWHWDVQDRALQCLIVAVATAIVTCWGVVVDHVWSFRVIGGILLQILLTTIIVPCIHHLFPRRSHQRTAP